MQLDWLDFLSKIGEYILIPLACLATVYVLTFLDAKKKEALAKADSEVAKKYIEMLDKTITECVLATNQTFVDSLKKNGAFTEEAQKQAFQLTYNTIMTILTDDAQEYLNEAISDLNAYITNKIEAQVVVTKQPVK